LTFFYSLSGTQTASTGHVTTENQGSAVLPTSAVQWATTKFDGVWQKLLEPFGITRFYTDGWGAYERHINAEQHHVGKENTQKIESKHINLRTRMKRLMRRTICFSKTEQMHDLVIGLFINRYEFGQAI
jgi:IS1 family transposase